MLRDVVLLEGEPVNRASNEFLPFVTLLKSLGVHNLIPDLSEEFLGLNDAVFPPLMFSHKPLGPSRLHSHLV